jgi:hypothetical protein
MDIETQKGFGLLRTILILAVLLVIISLLGVNFEQDVVQNEVVQTNFGYAVGWLADLWSNHLSAPVLYVWNDIFIELLWNPFVEMLINNDFYIG